MNSKLSLHLSRVSMVASLLSSSLVFAAPVSGNVVAGEANITQSGNYTTINQASSSAVINWQGFDTASNEYVRFYQPNMDSTVLNRITSGLPTNFAGHLSANGKVFIVNPAGMIFAKGSTVNAASIIATTLDINNSDFMKGEYKFFTHPGSENSSIINNGHLRAGSYSGYYTGVVALIAPNVINSESGMIYAVSGTVDLASGKAFVLDFNNDQLINFDASALVKEGHVENNGIINAMGGKVFMTTNTVSHVFDRLISTSGITEASHIIVEQGNQHDPNNGKIILSGKSQILASKVELHADKGIDITGKIADENQTEEGAYTMPGFDFLATTKNGNINLNNIYINMDNVSLSAPQGAIMETKSGSIYAKNLNTVSASGTQLDSKMNWVSNFAASNSVSGGIYLKNYGSLKTVAIANHAGGYNYDSVEFWDYYFGKD